MDGTCCRLWVAGWVKCAYPCHFDSRTSTLHSFGTDGVIVVGEGCMSVAPTGIQPCPRVAGGHSGGVGYHHLVLHSKHLQLHQDLQAKHQVAFRL